MGIAKHYAENHCDAILTCKCGDGAFKNIAELRHHIGTCLKFCTVMNN